MQFHLYRLSKFSVGVIEYISNKINPSGIDRKDLVIILQLELKLMGQI